MSARGLKSRQVCVFTRGSWSASLRDLPSPSSRTPGRRCRRRRFLYLWRRQETQICSTLNCFSSPASFTLAPGDPHAPELTMFELFEQLLLHLQQEVVVVLHLLRRVHHEGAHQVGAVRLVADPHGARDGAEVHVVLIAATETERFQLR